MTKAQKEELWRSIKNGDPISDSQLAAGIVWLSDLVIDLEALGAPFELARNDVRMRLIQLEGFRQARKDRS